jgi:hypothetical protein
LPECESLAIAALAPAVTVAVRGGQRRLAAQLAATLTALITSLYTQDLLSLPEVDTARWLEDRLGSTNDRVLLSPRC